MKTIKINSTGFDVLYLQLLLRKNGYTNICDDGIFGPNTDTVVRSFQLIQGLVVDGIVGPSTWKKLTSTLNIKNNKKLSGLDYNEIAVKYDLEVAMIKAVKEVESGQYGAFLSGGCPPILFEGHIFWEQLENEGLYPANLVIGNEDILYSKWTKQHYLSGMKEYDRLDKAMKINKIATLKSTSWGMFQIMGFNYKLCGCKSINEFIIRMMCSEKEQLDMFIQFIINNKLDKYLRSCDWAGFAKKYNGPGYAQNEYDTKLEQAYLKYKKEA